MNNLKTTITAVVTVVASLGARYGFDLSPDIQLAIVTIGVAITGILSKDHNTTGGTKYQ